MQEQMTDEFSEKLLDCLGIGFFELRKILKETWKQKGYIKQTQEEGIRRFIKEYKEGAYPINFEYFSRCLLELIEILDKKLKEKQNV